MVSQPQLDMQTAIGTRKPSRHRG